MNQRKYILILAGGILLTLQTACMNHDDHLRLGSEDKSPKYDENSENRTMKSEGTTADRSKQLLLGKDCFLGLLENNPTRAAEFLKQEKELIDRLQMKPEAYLIKYFLDNQLFALTEKKEITEKTESKQAIEKVVKTTKKALETTTGCRDYKSLATRAMKTGYETYQQTVPSEDWKSFIQGLDQMDPLQVAITYQMPVEVLEVLIALGADPTYCFIDSENSVKSYPLTIALEYKDEKGVACLIKAISKLSKEKKEEAYRILLQYNAEQEADILGLDKSAKQRIKQAEEASRKKAKEAELAAQEAAKAREKKAKAKDKLFDQMLESLERGEQPICPSSWVFYNTDSESKDDTDSESEYDTESESEYDTESESDLDEN